MPCRDALLAPNGGTAWVAHAPQQANAAVAAARGLALPTEPKQAQRRLADAAARLGSQAGFRFDAGERAARRLQIV